VPGSRDDLTHRDFDQAANVVNVMRFTAVAQHDGAIVRGPAVRSRGDKMTVRE
jgi:hypothetical protein